MVSIHKFITKIFTNKSGEISKALLPEVEICTTKLFQQRGVISITPYLAQSKNTSVFEALKYKKATTLSEAKEYAEKVLGIKKYDISDLELANQVNLSMTRGYNKTRGKLTLPENVEYTANFNVGNSKLLASEAPMQNLSYFPSAEIKCTENTLQINKSFFENVDEKITKYLHGFEKNGQLGKNIRGNDVINLISGYKYDHTLNRYYRLYKQDKLTTKAKVDFENLLNKANEQEMTLISSKEKLCGYIKTKTGVDLSNLPKDEFDKSARRYLLDIRKKFKIVLGNEHIQTKNAIGVDGMVLHELGHSWQAKISTGSNYEKYLLPYQRKEDMFIATGISPYASTTPAEGVAEIVKGLLSGDKYSDEIIALGNQYTAGKLSFLL